jgi:hypothetical protein
VLNVQARRTRSKRSASRSLVIRDRATNSDDQDDRAVRARSERSATSSQRPVTSVTIVKVCTITLVGASDDERLGSRLKRALGSTWTVLRQRRLPRFGGGRTTGVASRDVRQHPGEVGSLSRGVMSQPLSDPLQAGVRFLPRPLPAAPSAQLARKKTRTAMPPSAEAVPAEWITMVRKKTRTAMPPSAEAVPAEWITMVIFKDTQTRGS